MKPGRRAQACFTLSLWLIVLALVLGSRGLGAVARLVPLVVAIPTLLLLTFQLVGDLCPSLRVTRRLHEGRDRPPGAHGAPGSAGGSGAASPTERPVGAGRPPAVLSPRLALRFGWTLILPVSIYSFGFLVAVPLYAFTYLRCLSSERWLLALAIPAALGGLLLLWNRWMPALPLWSGWLWAFLGWV